MADILDEPLLPPEERPSLDIQDIMELLPHRYPFLLVDRVEWSRASKRSAIGYKGITYNEEYFQGHFPKMPVMPGVLQIEAMAQTAGLMILGSLDDGDDRTLKGVYFMSMDKTKFRKPVTPGCMLEMHVHVIKNRGLIYTFRGECYVDGARISEAEFVAMGIEDDGEA